MIAADRVFAMTMILAVLPYVDRSGVPEHKQPAKSQDSREDVHCINIRGTERMNVLCPSDGM